MSKYVLPTPSQQQAWKPLSRATVWEQAQLVAGGSIADSALGAAPCVGRQMWALTHYLSLKIAALSNTARLAGPRGTPRALGGRTALTLLKDICQGRP